MEPDQCIDPKALIDPHGYASLQKRYHSIQDQAKSRHQTPQAQQNFDQERQDTNVDSIYERQFNLQRRVEPPTKRQKTRTTQDEDHEDLVAPHKTQETTRGGRSGGELGQHMKELQQKHASRQTQVVDLTEEKDDDVVYLEDNLNREVCVGKVEGARVNAHRIPMVKTGSVGPQKVWPAMKVHLSRRPGTNTHIIGVADSLGKDIGTIDVKTATVLAPLMDSVRTSKVRLTSRLDPRPKKPYEYPGQSVSDHYAVTILIYAPHKTVSGIGKLFSQRGIRIQDPAMVERGIELVNPHAMKEKDSKKQKTLAASTSRYTNRPTHPTRTQEEVRQDVYRIFDHLKKSETLPEMEPPSLIKTPLLSHQKQALHFMTEREKKKHGELDEDETSLWQETDDHGRISWYHVITGHEINEPPEPVLGGILADVMGLGKTLNVLSLICSTKEQAHEFVTWPPPKPKFEGDRTDISCNNRATLLICPLSTMANWEEQIKQHIRNPKQNFTYTVYHGQNRTNEPEELEDYDLVLTTYSVVAADYEKRSKSRPRDPLGEINWFRIVIDEGHIIREQATRQSKAVCALMASRRWAVTGTPVQNRLDDLGALMKFLRIRPFDETKNFNQYIISPFKTADVEVMPKLRLLVDSITLRRLKDKIDLPGRDELITRLEMTETEREFYSYFARESARNINMMLKDRQTVGGKGYAHVLKAILRLRLLCAGGADLLNDDDWDAARGFSMNLAIDLEEINDKPDRTARQAFELYKMMKDANLNQCALCSRIIAHREIKDIGAEAEDDDEESDTPESQENDTFGHLAQCNELICNNCIDDFRSQCKNENAGVDNFGYCPHCETYTKFAFFEMTQHELEADEAAMRAVKSNPRLAKHAGRYSGPNSKTLALIRALEDDMEDSRSLMANGEAPIKSVIFSGWTTHLDLIQLALANSKIQYVRLDGSMSRKHRNEALRAFSEDDEIACILVSITAGGLGLNLTAASRVFVMEPQFNPAQEAQAIERVHRLGQKREVRIVKYIMENSFEEKMLMLQEKKRTLADMSLEGQKFDKEEKAKQKMEELRTLFK